MMSTPEEWEKLKKEYEAERAALESQKQLLDAREAILTANDQNKKNLDNKIKALNAEKAAAEAEKAVSDANKAKSDAALAALKSAIGEISSSGINGDVTVKDKAGVFETTLLASRSIKLAADKISKALPIAENKSILVFASSELPSFQASITFKAQINLIENTFENAKVLSKEADESEKVPPFPALKTFAINLAATPIVGSIGLALDAVNKIVSYFRTDYTITSVEVSLEDSMIVSALAGALVASKNKCIVKIPNTYFPDGANNAAENLVKQLVPFFSMKESASAETTRHENKYKELNTKAEATSSSVDKYGLLRSAEKHKKAADAWKGAVDLFDNYFKKISTPDEKGNVPLTTILKENTVLQSLLSGDFLIIAKVSKTGGTYYIKKNLFTFWGGMPFYSMGGVVISYTMFEGTTGKVVSSGLIPVHGGFFKADALKREIDRQ